MSSHSITQTCKQKMVWSNTDTVTAELVQKKSRYCCLCTQSNSFPGSRVFPSPLLTLTFYVRGGPLRWTSLYFKAIDITLNRPTIKFCQDTWRDAQFSDSLCIAPHSFDWVQHDFALPRVMFVGWSTI